MISLFRTFCFISCSLGAGMFSQQVVSKVYMADDDATAVLADSTEHWSSAERYYGRGCFRHVPLSSARTDDPAHDGLLAAVDQIDPLAADAGARPAPERNDVDPIPVPPEPAPELAQPAATEMTPDVVLPAAPPQPAAPQLITSDAVEPGLENRAADELESTPAPSEIDVLPLPTREVVVEGPSGFGVFEDEPGGLPRGTASSGPGGEADEDYAHQGPYQMPPGHSMRYVDPMDLVRRRAIERAENRRRRIEARKWLGYDPLRPAVNAMPYTTGDGVRPAFVVVPFVIRDER
jgi:hypothetical protein